MKLNTYEVTKDYNAFRIGDVVQLTSDQGIKLMKQGLIKLVREYDSEFVDVRRNKIGEIEFYNRYTNESVAAISKKGIEGLEKSKTFVYPENFGVKGNGSDETEAINEAFQNIKEGQILFFDPAKEYKFSRATIVKDHTGVTGGTLNGTLAVDAEYVSVYKTRTISEIPIELLWSRNIEIYNNRFINADKAIYVPPTNSINQTRHINSNVYNDPLFHANSKANIHGNLFKDVNYSVYADFYEGDDDPVDPTVRWMRMNDWHYVNNYVQDGLIMGAYIKGIDGLIVSENTFFARGGSTIKEQIIKIDHSNWLSINNNTLFEAGLESILLGEIGGLTITNNSIAWSGTREQSSAIKIGKQEQNKLVIASNSFTEITGHAVELDYGYAANKNTFGIITGNTAIFQSHYAGSYTGGKYLLYCKGQISKIQCKNNSCYGNLYAGIPTYNMMELTGEVMLERFWHEGNTITIEVDNNGTKSFPIIIKGTYNNASFWQTNVIVKRPDIALIENSNEEYGAASATIDNRTITLTMSGTGQTMATLECPFPTRVRSSTVN